eukprot:CAMPEP_0183293420 /NCGR_PEP_ID=MMETSP0160_2-20130417/2109_1 /TAXON_ID=2839 ORGANISM="Odontella Sinensis, Strain Grunow 1884" /NCGR_SAMPLE_ID=MMETSP0160_2 /ASSEMBLY_ACC=CAM_ASM_000250 /LENGTH=427 /DNA_ID=CAMNT_0025454531 /DNA_START=55 /DNA_END=1335 /DNA_ORIENTATION=+
MGSGSNSFNEICRRLASNDHSATTFVNLVGENLHGEGARRLAIALRDNDRATHLCLRRCYVHDSDLSVLVPAVRRSCRIVALDFTDNFVSCDGVALVAESLIRPSNSRLRCLRLASIGAGDKGASALASALGNNRSLRVLELGDNGFGADGVTNLSMALKFNRSLMQLDLSRNEEFGDKGFEAVASFLRSNSGLMRLNLSGTSMGDTGVKKLAQSLKANSALIEVDLSSNCISSCGATALASALEINCTLRSIRLGHNDIKDEGASNIAFSLFRNEVLSELHLNSCGITSIGASCLAIALQKNYALRRVNIRNNIDIHNPIKAYIKEALNKNNNLGFQTSKKGPFCLTRDGAERLPSTLKKRLLFVLWIAQKIDADRIVDEDRPLGSDIWWKILGMLCGNDLATAVPNAGVESWPICPTTSLRTCEW